MVISGRVLHGGPGGNPLARAWVVLHRVAMGGNGGPIDSVRTDRQGVFTLTIAQPDTGAMYIVSSWYDGIAYFSEPLTALRRTANLRPLLVYDTSSTGPPVRVARRLVTITRPKADGARDALELLELENPGQATRITRDTIQPTWSGAIPREAIQFQVSRGDVSPQAVTLRGDSVVVFSPLPPGEHKQLSYGYVLPANVRQVAVPIDQPTAELDLLLEDTTATVAAPGLDSLGVQAIEQRHFARYRTGALSPGMAVMIAFRERRRFQAESFVPVVVVLAAVALGVGFVVAMKRPRANPQAKA